MKKPSADFAEDESFLEGFYRGKKITVTGGLGFLGSALAIELVRLGSRVTLVDAMLPLYGGNPFNIEEIRDAVTVNVADIRDEGAMRWLVRDQDVIFHIGNQTSHVDSMTDPFLDVDINCRGNLVFLEACRTENSAVKIVYAGSRAEYGRPDHVPVAETQAMNPTDIYGVNKLAGELYHAIYHRAYGMRTTSLRINNTYGPRHQMKHSKYGILNWIIRLAIDGQTIPIYGTGGQLRDFNHIDDVTRAFLLAGSRSGTDGEAFNLGSGRPIAFLEIVEKVVGIAKSGRIEKVPWPEERKRIEVGDYVADIRKIKAALGWEPTVGLEEGLRETIDFYRRHKPHYWS
jgi:UDP-glucose 4-epimerase